MKEKLKVEEAPRPDSRSKRTVRLLKVGAFVRAYDWSAWLLKRNGSPLNEGLWKSSWHSLSQYDLYLVRPVLKN